MNLPPGWHTAAHSLWEQGHTEAALQACVAAVNEQSGQGQPAAALFDQLGYYFFVQGHHAQALIMMDQSHRLAPDNADTLRHLSVLNGRLRKHARAVSWAQKALKLAPEDPVCLDMLASALPHLNRFSEARAAGTRALIEKDQRAMAQARPRRDWQLAAPRPSAGQHRIGTLPNVVAFSLWGTQPRYLRGALRNALQAPQVLPGWTLRFYVDATVPPDFLALLREQGAQVVVQPGTRPASLRQRLSWRFQVANDPEVGYFLCRDADAVIGAREAASVNAWLDGEAHFHVIRDWWSHTDLMLAGLWGGVAGLLPSLKIMMRLYQAPAMETRNIDQWFLRDRVWPLVRQSVCMHDRFFSMPGSQPPPGPPPTEGTTDHIGQDEHAANPSAQAQALKHWLDRHDWL